MPHLSRTRHAFQRHEVVSNACVDGAQFCVIAGLNSFLQGEIDEAEFRKKKREKNPEPSQCASPDQAHTSASCTLSSRLLIGKDIPAEQTPGPPSMGLS